MAPVPPPAPDTPVPPAVARASRPSRRPRHRPLAALGLTAVVLAGTAVAGTAPSGAADSPTVTATPSTGLASEDASVVVAGSGFATVGTGVYVGVGPASAKGNADWATNASYYQGTQYVPTSDISGGAFSRTLTVDAVFSSNGGTVDCRLVECGVYTFAAHGSPDRSQDTYTPIAFAPAAPVWTPQVTVSTTTGLARTGETVTVQGSGFDPSANVGTRPPLAGQPAGVYVVFGKFVEPWRPSLGSATAPSSNRQVIAQKWAAPKAAEGTLAGTGQYVELRSDGTFTAELAVSMDEARSGAYGVYVYPGSGATNAAQELAVPMAFAPETADTTTPDTTTPDTTVPEPTTTVPTTPVPTTTDPGPGSTIPTGPLAVVGGHLDWGVKQSFRSYVTGGIGGGTASTTGGATSNTDGTFRFPAREGEVSGDASEVDARFGGTVRFTAHGGQLDLSLADLRVRTDGTRGVLTADVTSTPLQPGALAGGASAPQAPEVRDDVELATLDLIGSPGRVATTVTWSAIAATLTADGAPAFSGFYDAGTALDPLTVVLELDGTPAVPEGAPGSSGANGGSASAGPVSPSGRLPYTGTEHTGLLLAGATLVLGGGALGLAGTRRRAAATVRTGRR